MNRKQRRQAQRTQRVPAPPDFGDAVRLFHARRLDEAESVLLRLLGRNPRHAESLHLRGVIAHLRGQFGLAVDLLRQAVALNATQPQFRNNLGLSLLKTGDSATAVGEFGSALALAPDNAEIHGNLAKALQASGDLAAALQHYGRALSLKPSLVPVRCDWAAALYANGDFAGAIEQYEKVLDVDPEFAPARHDLGKVLYERGDLAGAERHLRRYLDSDPEDRQGARLLLAALGAEALPEGASEAYLRNLYAGRAAAWDGSPTYYAHRLVAEALEKHTTRTPLSIADAGCGTGLVGMLVRRMASRLDGVDLSKEMLDAAAAKNIYDALHQSDLTTWLGRSPAEYDAIVSAATLIHIGELRPVLQAAHAALRPGGLFIFTALLPADLRDDDRVTAGASSLALGGCFAHGRTYARNRAREVGFAVEALTDEVHEYSRGKAVPGMVVVLRKGPDHPG